MFLPMIAQLSLAFALYHQHKEHPTTCKGCNHLDSNLPEHHKDQKLSLTEIPTKPILHHSETNTVEFLTEKSIRHKL
uniref:Uncharacterized protein n=1 Tax=Lotus japonicus TaxID=34305 RepID=I3SAW8_LOTJA|nr:unknown [Lotus japonicus]